MQEPMTPDLPLGFMFGRRRDIELETGLLLAGMLVVDLPKDAKLKRRHRRMIGEIVQRLSAAARSGQMQDATIVFGWRDGRRPDNADDFVNSDEAQTNWAKDRLTIAVRVDPRDDGKVRMDRDLVWQLGLVKQH